MAETLQATFDTGIGLGNEERKGPGSKFPRPKGGLFGALEEGLSHIEMPGIQWR
jgi:hypothetical protein